ncbi:MAG: hypothetical protein U5K43_10105 [Halofilum sp. (in: g-proteobacteria)]|nr:hypothetical protein [Halofilum sp. (in: g-proteobacteria)]
MPPSTEFGHHRFFQNFRAITTGKDVPQERKQKLNSALNANFTSDEFQKFCKRTYTCTTRDIAETREFIVNYHDNVAATEQRVISRLREGAHPRGRSAIEQSLTGPPVHAGVFARAAARPWSGDARCAT